MESLKQYWNSWWVENDGRKKAYYSLPDKSQNKAHRYRIQKPRNIRPRYESRDIAQPKTKAVEQRHSTWSKLKSLFDTDKRDITEMKHAYVDYKLPATEQSSTQFEINKLLANERFKKKLMEKRYEENMLDELRRGRPRISTARRANMDARRAINHADEVILLRTKIEKLERRLSNALEELAITKKKLEFAKEKNSLLEELFDDGNMETEYVKSRRNIMNLQNSDRKPELKQLPRSPSPVLHVDPMFTSSPIRGTLAEPNSDAFKNDAFYEKYPKIPETERLGSYYSPENFSRNNRDPKNENSLSPVRVDYSKYSGA